MIEVNVRENNIDQAVRILKKKLQREGVFREIKLRRRYIKPCFKREMERVESIRRKRRAIRKRMEIFGY